MTTGASEAFDAVSKDPMLDRVGLRFVWMRVHADFRKIMVVHMAQVRGILKKAVEDEGILSADTATVFEAEVARFGLVSDEAALLEVFRHVDLGGVPELGDRGFMLCAEVSCVNPKPHGSFVGMSTAEWRYCCGKFERRMDVLNACYNLVLRNHLTVEQGIAMFQLADRALSPVA